MSLFSFGNNLLKKHPYLLKLSAVVYNFCSFNQIRRGSGNVIKIGTSFLTKCRITISGKNNQIVFGDKCYLDHTSISIVGNNSKVIMGDSVCVYNGSFCLEDDGGTVSIGYKTLICGPSHFACIDGTKIEIGKECLFSSETVIRTGDSHSVLDFEGKRVNPSMDVTIGDRVWLGHRAMCLKGARLGDDSVIAAGAILTKPIKKANVVIAGIPAIIVKENIKWCRERL